MIRSVVVVAVAVVGCLLLVLLPLVLDDIVAVAVAVLWHRRISNLLLVRHVGNSIKVLLSLLLLPLVAAVVLVL